MGIKHQIDKFRIRRRWRAANSHNNTTIKDVFTCDFSQIKVGKGTYGDLWLKNVSRDRKLVIGNYCSIGNEVEFYVCIDHPTNLISTYPFKSLILGNPDDTISKGDIIIDDDVWIGGHSVILSGVHIGQGAVIGAGSVITRDVPPYAVVAGSPAKVMKYRFEPEVIDKLLTIDYSRLDEAVIKENLNSLYTKVDRTNVDELIRDLPRKE